MRGLRKRKLVMALALTLAVSTGIFGVARAVDIGDILLIGGIVLVVSTFGSQINDFINNLLAQREAATVGATRVVPIFSVGQGLYVGAAQVVGLPASVRRVQAVAAVNIVSGQLEGTGLVPISTQTPGTVLDTVSGVGINAVIDFHI